MAWPWCFRSFLLTSNIVFFVFFHFFIITTDCARDLANSPQSLRKFPCVASNLGREIHCKLDRWSNELRALPWPKSRVRHLHIEILHQNSELTVNHLSGFSSLDSLIIRGRCVDPIDPTKKGSAMEVCHEMRGLSAIRRHAFIRTPYLRRLYLHSHPMPILSNLQQLRRLRHLHIKQAFALRRIEKKSLVRSLETLSVLQNNISIIRSSMFKGMDNLRELSWSFINPNLLVQTLAIANMPRLASIWLICVWNCMVHKVTFSPQSIAHLPSLEVVSFRRLFNIDFLGAENRPICNLTNVSIRHLYVDSSAAVLLRNCYDLWRCEKCGSEPDEYSQSIVLRNIWGEMFGGDRNLRLESILPPFKKIHQLNVSMFYSASSPFTDIQDELARFPLIKRFHFHSPDPGNNHILFKLRSTFRLVNNPLAFLPNPRRVISVRFAIRYCDCFVTEMILWARQNMPSNSDDDAVLKLACSNMQCSCAAGDPQVDILNEPNQWLSLNFIMRQLRPYCAPGGAFYGGRIPQRMCTVEKHCPAYVEEPRKHRNSKKMTVVIKNSNSAVHLKPGCLSVLSIWFSMFSYAIYVEQLCRLITV